MRRLLGPTVSVVISAYNYGRYLAMAVESVLAQSYRDFELVIVDDGSTDDTPDVVRRYLDQPQVRYFRKPNGGQASAKNRGIQESVGAFVAFLDADDVWHTDKLARQLPLFLGRPEVGVVFSGVHCVDREGKPAGEWTMPAYRGAVTQELFIDNFVPFSSAVVRRECFERLGVFDESLPMAIDYDLWLRFSVEYEMDYVPDPLLFYRMGHGQMSGNVELRFQCASRVARAFMKRHPGVIDRETYRRDRAYSLRSRGDYYGQRSVLRGLAYYARAIAFGPFEVRTYKRIARLVADRLSRPWQALQRI